MTAVAVMRGEEHEDLGGGGRAVACVLSDGDGVC